MNRTWSVVAGLLLTASAVLVLGGALDWWSLSFQVGSRIVGDGVVSLLLAGVSVAIALVVVLDLWELEHEEERSLFNERSTTRLDDPVAIQNLVRPTPTPAAHDLDWPETPDPLGVDLTEPFGFPAAEEAPAAPVEPHLFPEPAPIFATAPLAASPVEPAAESRVVLDLTDGPTPAHLLLEGGAEVIDLSNFTDEEILTSIAAGEAQVVDLLLDQGYLTTSGPLTDGDTAVLVFVSVTTDELVAVLTGHGYLDNDGQITERLDEARRFRANPPSGADRVEPVGSPVG